MIEKYKKEIKKWEEKLEELLSKKPELISNVANNKQIQDEEFMQLVNQKKLMKLCMLGEQK